MLLNKRVVAPFAFDKAKSMFKPQGIVGKCRPLEDKTQSAAAGKSLGSVG